MQRWSVMVVVAASLVVGALPAGSPAASRAPSACPAGSGAWRVGAAKADITPTQWPVAEAAYGIGRLAVGAAHPFYARAVAIQSCTNGQTIVLAAIDSQGYFAGYKEDPPSAVTAPTTGYGTAAIRQIVARDTGLPTADVLVASTHTHNSPDSVGVWGGGTVANNKAPYLERVRTQTVKAIEAAMAALRPARLSVGSADISTLQSTFTQVARDPADYPVDHTLRVLQATDANDCSPIATLVNASVHATAAGEIDGPKGDQSKGLIDPDWPGRVADALEQSLPGDGAVVVAGALGRVQPAFPAHTDPKSQDQSAEATAYGAVMERRVQTALADAQPVAPGPVQVVEAQLQEELAEPALVPLFADESGVSDPRTGKLALGGVMRSIIPPFAAGPALSADLQTFRVGGLLMAGVPGEPYPEVATELAKRVRSASTPFVFGLAEDQLGYTPPAFEYPVVAVEDGSDEGIFSINSHFGDDVITQHLSAAQALGFPTTGGYNGATAGPVQPPDQNATYPTPPSPPEPQEKPLALSCGGGPRDMGATVTSITPGGASATVSADGSHVQVAGVAQVSLPSTHRCVSRRALTIHLARHRGVRILSAAVLVPGHRAHVRFGRRLRAAISLGGLPPGRFRVQIVVRLLSHGHPRTLRITRTYHTCVPRRR